MVYLLFLINHFMMISASWADGGRSCNDILSPYKVPPGFQQDVYEKALSAYQKIAKPFETARFTNPNSVTTPAEKIHLYALITAADLGTDDMAPLTKWSQHLPERQRETFEKLAQLSIRAKKGNLNEVSGFLEKLLEDGKYAVWFEFVTKFHLGMQNVESEPVSEFGQIPVSDSIKSFLSKSGITVSQHSASHTYLRFSQPLMWSTPQSLTKHFIKRTQKDGYPFLTEQDLLNAANNFLLSRRADQMTFLRPDGTYAVYDLSTKELAIVSADNKIITYYILSTRYQHPDDLATYMKYVFTEPPARN